ncbi:MAG: hypothetical protein EWM72_00774 [Nitrospira sp.]|nr:MAG: hypothetical protein EWM72_00774 [Nitrospira sp.]
MFLQLLERLATALDLAKIPYMIIGGQAVLLYGEPRLTRDIDVTLGIDVDRVSDLLKVATQLSLTPPFRGSSCVVRESSLDWTRPATSSVESDGEPAEP